MCSSSHIIFDKLLYKPEIKFDKTASLCLSGLFFCLCHILVFGNDKEEIKTAVIEPADYTYSSYRLVQKKACSVQRKATSAVQIPGCPVSIGSER